MHEQTLCHKGYAADYVHITETRPVNHLKKLPDIGHWLDEKTDVDEVVKYARHRAMGKEELRITNYGCFASLAMTILRTGNTEADFLYGTLCAFVVKTLNH